MQQRDWAIVDAAVKHKVPYFSQWETPDMTLAVVAEGAQAALLKDPLWASSGARNVEDYARWAGNLCGMACLKMVLAARTGKTVPIMDLAMGCKDHGGYVEEQDGRIKGLIYAPFVPFVRDRFGLNARVVTGIPVAEIGDILTQSQFFIASVHHSIRWQDTVPPAKGGHLVLVTALEGDLIRFHNPSGHIAATRENVGMPLETFDRFFAGRGIAIDR
ncbi:MULTISPECIES: C39 family peptidase [Rhizobium]|uniref:C39 family peptidase n=1 Tax=Rhizobium TaxID=379 RepID=UPI00195B11E2|nr:C39 family peptidase [Rhizobium lusitanum]MBM7045325.1 C39 family peptidase [Rhizobium lusitanum]